MSLKIELPPDVEKAALGIPNLNQRLAAFVRHQVDLEAWRSHHGSAEARALVDEAFAKGDAMKAAGLTYEQAFAMFEEVHERRSLRDDG
jgi:outer membrane protein TolC